MSRRITENLEMAKKEKEKKRLLDVLSKRLPVTFIVFELFYNFINAINANHS